jgi:hypothetical protein
LRTHARVANRRTSRTAGAARAVAVDDELAFTTGGDVPAATYLPPSHYRALFELGRKWRYHAHSEHDFVDPDDPAADRHGNVKETGSIDLECEVIEVRAFPHAAATNISCSEGAEISGTYAAVDDGLYQIERFPKNERELTGLPERAKLISAVPRSELHHEQYPEGVVDRAVQRTPEGYWCRNDSDTIGDEGSLSICFGDGLGIVSYASSWAGGSSREVRIDLIR